MDKRELALLTAAIAAGLLIRLVIAPAPGFVSDYQWHEGWSWFLAHYGLERIYRPPDVGVQLRSVDYPPFYLYVLDFTGRVFKRLDPQGFLRPDGMPPAVMKVNQIVVETLTALLVYVIVRKKASFTASYLSMLAYLFNPAVIYTTAYWGQTDAWGIAFALASVLALANNWVALSVFLITAGIFMKVYYLLFLPLIFYYILRKHGARKTCYAGFILLLSSFFILLPIIWTGQLSVMVNTVVHSSDKYARVSVNAYNLWRLTYSEDVERSYRAAPSDETPLPLLGSLTPEFIGLAAYALFLVWVIRFKVKDKAGLDSPLFVGFMLSYGFFMLPTRIHERYLYPAFGFLAAVMHRDRKLQAVYALLTLFFLVNLVHVLSTHYPNSFGKHLFDGIYGEVKATSLLNTLLFAYTLGLSFNAKSIFKDNRKLRLILYGGSALAVLYMLSQNTTLITSVSAESLAGEVGDAKTPELSLSLTLSRIAVFLPLILFADLLKQLAKFKLSQKKLTALLALVLLLIIQSVMSMRGENLTFDESGHIAGGYAYLTCGEFRAGGLVSMEHPPLVRSIAALPLTFIDGIGFKTDDARLPSAGIFTLGSELVYGNPQKTEAIILSSRLMIVMLSALLGLYVFLWSARLYGTNAGFLSLFLYAFNPLVLAHSRLVTTDVGGTLFFFTAVYYLWNYLKEPSVNNLLLSGISLGLGIVAKVSGALLIPTTIILVIALSNRNKKKAGTPLKTSGIRLVVLMATALLVVNAAYGFKDILRPLGSFKATSSISGITTLPYVKQIPVPLPEPFVLGLDYGLRHSEQGHISYFLGTVSSKGVWYYYAVLFLIKNPLPLLLMLLVSLLCCVNHRKERVNDAFLLLPVILVFIVLSRGHANIGLRHALPAFPFIFVYLGRLATCHPIQKAVYVLCFFYLVSAISIYPHYIAYFNELVGGPDNGFRYAVVSDLDWGQDMKGLAAYVRENNVTGLVYSKYGTASTEYYGLSYTPLECGKTRGFIAIHAINLMREPNCNGWLMDYAPTGKIGYSIFLYNITD